MASVDPYSPCPCGSGQKFKWCCHKVEAYADRAQRLFENGQTELALSAIDEGLRKDTGNPWLLTRKAVYLLRQEQPEAAKTALRQVLEKQPQHMGTLQLLTRLVVETEGNEPGAAQFQQALSAVPPEGRTALGGLARVVGAFLTEGFLFIAALQHLKLAQRLDPAQEGEVASALRTIEGSPSVPTAQKAEFLLSPAPEGLSPEARQRFTQSLEWADEGLWSAAAASFETLSADHVGTMEADRNAGLCRVWMADNAGGVAALRRAIARMGNTEEAVDLETLCQQLAPLSPDDLVEEVQLIWPLRDRQDLISRLKSDASVHAEEDAPLDPDTPNSPPAQQFGLLDRPAVEDRIDLRAAEIPRFVGRVKVGQEIVVLETYDDGRLDSLIDRFIALADTAIPPAHPRTKILDKVGRASLALTWEWLLPKGTDRSIVPRLNEEQGIQLIQEIWPATPLPYLQGRTPLQAAEGGDAEVPLRAAVLQLEQSQENWHEKVDYAGLRARLKIGAEPAIDPETVDIARLHPARLSLVPVAQLSDEKLVELYYRSRDMGLLKLIHKTASALLARPESWKQFGVSSVALYSDLALASATKDQLDEALEWTRRGRQADPAAYRARLAPHWDLLEIRLKARSLGPESWVPDLAVALERYQQVPEASQLLLSALVDLGLVEVRPNPDNPDDFLLDTRVLQAIMTRYGPRVTTAGGQLGIAATRGGLWTPGSETAPTTSGGGSGIWTPGSGSAAGSPPPPAKAGPSKLIIPGR